MQFLKNFEDFLFEAVKKDPHFSERETERLLETSEIKLPPPAVKFIQDQGIEFRAAEIEMLKIIKDEVRERIKAMLRVDFPPTISFMLSVKKYEFEFGGQRVPLNIVAYSKGKGGKINKHIGNQYWIPCYRNTFYTLMLFPAQTSEEEISDSGSSNLRRNFGVVQKTTVSTDDDFLSLLTVEDGKIVKVREQKGQAISKTVDISGQWMLSPGREFKFWMPAKSGWVRGEIVKVDNDPGYKTDRQFRIEMLVEIGDKKVKMLKKISPGDKLLIPVKTEDGEIDVPVTVHDSLYVVDKRAASPILKFV